MRVSRDSHFSVNPDGPDASRPSVLVRLGALDSAAIRQARQVFADAAVIGATAVVVDVGGLDDRHELSGFALLTELSRRLGESGGALSVVNPPPRLAGHLQACGIHVRWDVTGIPNGDLTLQIGRQPDWQEHRAQVTYEPAAPAQPNESERRRAQ